MKLSIILPFQKNKKRSVLKALINEDFQSSNFEIVVIVDNNIFPKNFKHLNFLKEKYQDRVKVIFNSRNQGINKNIVEGIKYASGEYFFVLTQNNHIKKSFISQLLYLINKFDSDIIEFRMKTRGLIDFEPKQRIKTKSKVSIEEKPEILAFSFPLLFNKIFKKSIFDEIDKNKVLKLYNTKFSVELLYFAFFYAKTYVYVNTEIIEEHIDKNDLFSPTMFYKEWKNILDFYQKNESPFLSELFYSYFYFFLVYSTGILANLKEGKIRNLINVMENKSINNSVALKKLTKVIDNILEKDKSNFKSTNKYMMLKNQETQMMLNPLKESDWEKILHLLE
ncbi:GLYCOSYLTRANSFERASE [Mycoplasmopsis pulmonis]|uniref:GLYCOSYLTRANSFERASE n=1 Tax=Mycoplasmopsis pulmonis (strain UAB CTIP) TaxID=272635 RepID=Q98PF3_MYCPU|nr:glycosyltransferase [Mycoplasmopsis pulmonis]MDZ7293387.1 glycosyltransferase [Mycoplasmopsis pulmonis]CAC13943.1 GLYCOSYLTRANSFERASE [Mycoplasmopsis pulmonis]